MKTFATLGFAIAINTVAFAGCSPSDRTETDRKGSGPGEATVFASIPGALTDPNIFFILGTAHALDSSAGAMATTKATRSDIREFGRMMVRDHHALREQGQMLATRLALTPAPAAGDDVQGRADRTLAALDAAAKGKDFDKAYIDSEVNAHRALLETTVAAMRATKNSELKNLLQKAAPTIQAHLDRAQSIQKKNDE